MKLDDGMSRPGRQNTEQNTKSHTSKVKNI